MGDQYLNQIIGTKAQRRSEYYARKAANRAAREMQSFKNDNISHLTTIEFAHSGEGDEGVKPAKATYYKGQVIVRSGANGQGKEVARGMVHDGATVADVCQSVIQAGYYIVNKNWMERI